jgi:hypothetical protein
MVPAGQRFGRIYLDRFTDPLGYGKTRSRFSDPRRRVEANRFGVIYLGASLKVCFIEAVLRDRRNGAVADYPIEEAELASWRFGEITTTSVLSLVDLRGDAPIRIGVPSDVVGAWTQSVARVVRRVPRSPCRPGRDHLFLAAERGDEPRHLRPRRVEAARRPHPSAARCARVQPGPEQPTCRTRLRLGLVTARASACTKRGRADQVLGDPERNLHNRRVHHVYLRHMRPSDLEKGPFPVNIPVFFRERLVSYPSPPAQAGEEL